MQVLASVKPRAGLGPGSTFHNVPGTSQVSGLLLVPAGSAKEREVYLKAGQRMEEPGHAEPLQLSVQHVTAMFGMDFDVVVEVRVLGGGFVAWCLTSERLCVQMKNVQGSSVGGHLTVLAKAVTYNSMFRGECRRQNISVNMPARSG